MNEGFEFTLHALKSPAFGRFFAGFHPVCGRLLAPWVACRRLVGWVGLEAGVCSGVRGGGAKQKGRNRGIGKKKKEERGCREGGHRGRGKGEIRGTRNDHFALPYSLSFIRPKVAHI